MGLISPLRAAACALSLAAASTLALGQPKERASFGKQEIELSASVRALIAAPYLSDDERRAARVFHGQWTANDLEAPALRARAALIAGVWNHPVFASAEVPAEDRAEAMLLRGDLAESVAALEGVAGVRAARIRAEAFEGLGRFKEADEAVAPAVEGLAVAAPTAEDVAEGVRALNVRARVRGQPARDYQRMMGLLGRAHDEIDRQDYRSMLMEASLLLEKDNRGQAGETLLQALALNPSLAAGWSMLGRMAVDAFEFEAARGAAANLDAIAARIGGEGAVSPLAAEIRALAWLRQKEPDLTEQELAPVLAAYPGRRESLALRAAAASLRVDDAERDRRLAEFEALSPGSPLALFQAGKALSEARQYGEAADMLRRASERQPNWPLPLIELGLLEVQSGRDGKAMEALRRVAELDPFNVRAANSLKLVEELGKYERIETPHFVLRFTEADRVMAEEMPPALERMHAIVAGALQHTPEQKTTIELMPDHEWFAVRITGMPDIHTIAASTGPVIAMESPRVGPRHTGEYDWERVVRHEYVHTVGLSRTKNRIPHWFTEAMAVHYELAPRDQSDCELLAEALRRGELFDMRKINIAVVRPEKPTDRQQAYAQGAWMYDFIIGRWGEDAPLRMMDLYAKGVSEPAAIQAVLGVAQESFFGLFVEWARGQVKAWGMAPEPSLARIRRDATLAESDGRRAVRECLREMGLRLATRGAGLASAAAPKEIEAVEPTAERVDGWLAAHPDHPDLLRLRLGLMLEASPGGATAGMIPMLEAYAAARQVDMEPRRVLARLRLASGDRAGAAAHLEALDAREQRTAAYAVELSRIFAEQGRLDEASAKAERAVKIAPFNGQHRELAATVAILRKDYATAERHIAALTRLEPDQPVHYQRLQKIRERRGAAN